MTERFELLHLISGADTAETYRATDTATGDPVFLVLLREELAVGATAVKAFREEAAGYYPGHHILHRGVSADRPCVAFAVEPDSPPTLPTEGLVPVGHRTPGQDPRPPPERIATLDGREYKLWTPGVEGVHRTRTTKYPIPLRAILWGGALALAAAVAGISWIVKAVL